MLCSALLCCAVLCSALLKAIGMELRVLLQIMNIHLLLLFVFFCNVHLCGSAKSNPIVELKQSKVEGKVHESARFTCDAFLGVPYAKPPVGEGRFSKPEPLDPMGDFVYPAVHMPSRCTQMIEYRTELFGMESESEDCLYLNVIRPHTVPSSPLPVMVFIHGGSFRSGSAKQYGVDGPCKNIVSKGVILVIPQYRVGLFGFLSTGDSAAPGNWGIWDQIEALKWVQENIARFGGDPNSVTLFGESAGAVCLSILSYGDLTQDLYHRTIQQSGSALTPLFLKEDHTAGSRALAEYACNLTAPTSQQMLQCLRSLSGLQLHVNNVRTFERKLRDPLAPDVPGWTWLPVVDGEIIKHNWINLHQAANAKPAIIGTNEFELGWFVQLPSYMRQTREHSATVVSEEHISAQHFDFAIAAMAPTSVSADTISAVQKIAKHVYINSQEVGNNKTKLMEQYIRLVSDAWFNVPSILDAKAKTAAGAKVFLYNFDYYCENIFPKDHKFKSSQHSFELFHLFYMSFNKLTCGEFTENDDRISDKLATMFTNFAKYGDPNPVDPVWPHWVSMEEPVNYRIGLQSHVDRTFHHEGVHFWTHILPQLLNGHQEL